MAEVATAKRCPKCGMVKDASAFSPHAGASSGLSSYCKPCHNACSRTYAVKYKHVMSQTCSVCKEEKTASEFYPDLRRKSGLGRMCKVCTVKHVAKWRRTPTGRQKHKERNRNYWRNPANKTRGYFTAMLRKYGLSKVEFDEMILAQVGRCAGCGDVFQNKPKAVHVDHCHVNGWVRGLLCNQCNQILGLAHDDPKKLYALAAYLFRETIS